MLKLFEFAKRFCKNFAYFLFGIFVLTGLTIFGFCSLPFYLYRWIVCNVLAPCCKGSGGKAVAAISSIFATELIEGENRTSSRGAIVVSIALEGTVSPEDAQNIIQEGLMSVDKRGGGKLKYPELRQYVEKWMGYIFWKSDKAFDIQNHLTHHQCGESWTDGDCEQFSRSIVEDLLNKPFPTGRSPWEVHLIHGYRNTDLSIGKEMTLVVSRFHHCVADGFGILSLVSEGILGMLIADCAIPALKKLESEGASFGVDNRNAITKIVSLASFPFRVVRDVGYGASIFVLPIQTPWIIPECKRTWQQFFDRSGSIPISKIKFVKDKLGVSFTAVLLSSIAAGTANAFQSKGFPNHIKNMSFGSPLPLKGHPEKLRNHLTVALYKLPIDQAMSPLERLKESERRLQIAKNSTIPISALFIIKMLASHIPSVSKFLFTNRTLSTALTSFPGPGIKLGAHGMTAVSTDFAVGLLLGVAGIGFMTLSYCDHIRIAAVAENAAMDRKELDELIRTICNEIDNLHDLAMSKDSVEICMDEETNMIA